MSADLDFRELVLRGVESDELDYKAAQSWNTMSKAGRGKIIRHLIAFANARGGCIVIGVGEDRSGSPTLYQGLTREQARSFDPTPVGVFVNRYVDPPIDFTIERPVIDGKIYAIFVVRPFSTLPHVCTQTLDPELQMGVFYIRTPEASSRPACKAIELHQIIQRALRNQRELLGRMLRGILYENRALDQKPENRNDFADAERQAEIYFTRRRTPPAGTMCWRVKFVVEPDKFRRDAFSLEELRSAIADQMTLRLGSRFVTERELRSVRSDNVALRQLPENELRFWQMGTSGQFIYLAYLELEDGALAFEDLLQFVAEITDVTGQLYPSLNIDPEQLLTVRLEFENTDAGALECGGRRFPAVTSPVAVELRRSIADLASAVETHAARLLGGIAEKFALPDKLLDGLAGRIRKYLENR